MLVAGWEDSYAQGSHDINVASCSYAFDLLCCLNTCFGAAIDRADQDSLNTMIRRPPTAIHVSSVEVEELKAYRKQQKDAEAIKDGRSGDNQSKQPQDGEASQMDKAEDAGVGEGGAAAYEHPADRAARLRREATAAQRMGL